MMPAIALVAAYLIGAIPFGFLLVKWKTGEDIRLSGSGNIGATNVTRTTGWTIGLATLILDIAKGYLAVWLAGRLTGASPLWMSAAAVAVMAGHAFHASSVKSSTFLDPGTSTTSAGSTSVFSILLTNCATASRASKIPLAGV